MNIKSSSSSSSSEVSKVNQENIGRIFTIKTIKSVIIKTLIEVMKPYIKECSIRITQDYIKISTTDIAKKTITYTKLDASKFVRYFCKQPKTIGIDISTLYKAIKSASKNDTLTLYIDENDPDKLGINLDDPFNGKSKGYKIPLLTLQSDSIIDIKDLEFECILNMKTVQFQQIIKDIQLLEGKIVEIKNIGKQLIFSCKDGIAEFRTSITELGQEQKTILQTSGENSKSVKFEKYSDKIVQGQFKMVHLMHFIKASRLCESMNILLANDNPLVLEYYVADLGILRLLALPVDI